MTEAEQQHTTTQHHIQLLLPLLRNLKLQEFVDAHERADTVGPFFNPTLWRQGQDSGRVRLVREIAKALLGAQRGILKAEREYMERHGTEEEKAQYQLATGIEL